MRKKADNVLLATDGIGDLKCIAACGGSGGNNRKERRRSPDQTQPFNDTVCEKRPTPSSKLSALKKTAIFASPERRGKRRETARKSPDLVSKQLEKNSFS